MKRLNGEKHSEMAFRRLDVWEEEQGHSCRTQTGKEQIDRQSYYSTGLDHTTPGWSEMYREREREKEKERSGRLENPKASKSTCLSALHKVIIMKMLYFYKFIRLPSVRKPITGIVLV